MKNKLTILLILLPLLMKADIWTAKTNFGGGVRESAIGLSIGGYGYIGSGWNGTNDVGDFWQFDPGLNTWTQMATFITLNREASTAFSVSGKGYVSTGSPNSNDLWEYDPAGNSWVQKSNFGGAARYGSAGFSIGAKGYMGTGNASSTFNDDFWEYDPALDVWTQLANVPGGPRMWSVGFAINTKGYIATGLNSAGKMNDLQEYDPVSNTWTQKAGFTGVARDISVGFSVGNFGYIGTGRNATSGTLNDFWEYSQSSNTWTPKTAFPGATREWAVGFGIGNKGYLGTGGSSLLYGDFYEYTPDSVIFQSPQSMFSANDTVFCQNSCITFTDQSINTPTSWLWSFPGADTVSSTLQNPGTVCYPNAGTFDVTLVTCNGIGCDTLVFPSYITVHALPVATITQSHDTLFSSPAGTYQWGLFPFGNIAGATNSFYVVPNNGNYFVFITDSFGCQDSSNFILINTKVETHANQTAITFYPNPFHSLLTLGIQKQNIKHAELKIRNRLGQIVCSLIEHNSTQLFHKTIDLRFLPEGLYLLDAEIDGEHYVKKIVKE